MKTFTIEWNAVTTLEDEGRPGREALLELVTLHSEKIDLGIATTAASENTRSAELPRSAEEFRSRLESCGLGDLTMVFTVCVWDLTYCGLCRFGEKNASELPEKLWPLIKPTQSVPMSHVEFAEKNGLPGDSRVFSPAFAKWRNKFCDVYSLEAHIAAERDVFVTGDVKNFKGFRRERLAELGVGEICDYDQALAIAKSL